MPLLRQKQSTVILLQKKTPAMEWVAGSSTPVAECYWAVHANNKGIAAELHECTAALIALTILVR